MNREQQTKIFFEIVRENINDEYVTTIPAGEFQCCQVNMTPEIDILEQIEMTFGREKKEDIIISNMLLEKYQICLCVGLQLVEILSLRMMEGISWKL